MIHYYLEQGKGKLLYVLNILMVNTFFFFSFFSDPLSCLSMYVSVRVYFEIGRIRHYGL